MAGKVDTVCFDKTGTLTFEGLSMMALRPARTAEGGEEAEFEAEVSAEAVGGCCALGAPPRGQRESLALCMASCQAVRLLDTPSGVEMARAGSPTLRSSNPHWAAALLGNCRLAL